MENCKHNWIDIEDGSLDKICVTCGKKAMQMVATLPLPSSAAPTIQPVLRETIQIHMGGDFGTVDVYKDRLAEEINKQLSVSMMNRGVMFGG